MRLDVNNPESLGPVIEALPSGDLLKFVLDELPEFSMDDSPEQTE